MTCRSSNSRPPGDAWRLRYAPNQEPTLELHIRAAPSVEVHHLVSGPTTGRNSGGRQIKKPICLKKCDFIHFEISFCGKIKEVQTPADVFKDVVTLIYFRENKWVSSCPFLLGTTEEGFL